MGKKLTGKTADATVENNAEETMETVKEARNTAVDKEYSFILRGSRIAYKGITNLLKESQNGEEPTFILRIEDGKVIGFQGDVMVGYLHMNPSIDVQVSSPMDIEKLVALNGEIEAVGVGTRTTSVVCQIRPNKEDEEEPVNFDIGKSGKELQEELIEEKGLSTKKEMAERVTYMKECGLTQKQMDAVFASYVEYPAEYAMRIPSKPLVPYVDHEGFVPEAIAYVNCQNNLLFEGDKAVGKNVLVETLAWLYKRPVFTLPMNADYDNNTLIGTRTIETNEKGETEMKFELGVVAEAAKNGCIIVFDEFNTAHPGLMTVFHSLLDKNRKLEVSGYGLIEAHDNFFAIATQNLDYQGTMDNNQATASRFVPFLFPQLESIAEIIKRNVPSVSKETLGKVQPIFERLRKLVHDGEIEKEALDVRGFEAAVEVYCLMDIPLEKALKTNIANRMSDEHERQIVASLIDNLL